MFYYINGKLALKEIGTAVLDVGGVGYKLTISGTTYDALPAANSLTGEAKQVKLFTYLAVREDDIELFGFYSGEELSAFKMLISVSGVGPKAALSILSDITPSKLALCIATGDSKTLTKSPGIGTKIAQRIVLELKDKIAKEQHFSSEALQSVPQVAKNNVSEAMEALAVLGFAPAQINSALMGADVNASVEDLIKFGLKNISS